MTDQDDISVKKIDRRQRAPTITIDTSAVNNSSPPSPKSSPFPKQENSNSQDISRDDSTPYTTEDAEFSASTSRSDQPSRIGVSDVGPSISLSNRERESRPASSQNVLSPSISRGEKSTGFLAVPGTRSRQNSIESEGENRAETVLSGETVSIAFGDNEESYMKSPENDDVMKDTKALDPDPGTEAEFETDSSPFAFSQGQLNKLINPKSLSAFYTLGGLAGIEKGLRTDRKVGLSIDEKILPGKVTFDEAREAASVNQSTTKPGSKIPAQELSSSELVRSGSESTYQEKTYLDRRRIYKDNRLPAKKGKSLLKIMWITYNDKVLILLSIAAVVSLAVGLYQTFGMKHDSEHPPIEWVEGTAIIGAILIVLTVGSMNDWQKERQFVKLNSKKQDRIVNVIRSAKTLEISIHDVLVGDVLHLEPGDMVPADGIYIDGHDLKCDESQITGESDIIRKYPADQVYKAIVSYEKLRKLDPFILSGSIVTQGVGTFMVTSTGVNSSYGKTLMSLRVDPEMTPLQSKLNTLAEYIAKLGGGAGLLLFIVLFIEFLIRLPGNTAPAVVKGQEFLQIFITTVTIIVVAVPEGLPLAVTLALAFATTRMLKDNNLVRHLKACEVMGNATAICSDKTGTLTQNKMQVVAGTIGTTLHFGEPSEASQSESQTENHEQSKLKPKTCLSPRDFTSSLDLEAKLLLTQSITINSTAFEGEAQGEKTFIGSKTETALLSFAKLYLGIGPIDQERSNSNVVQFFPFDSGRKCMGVVAKLSDSKYRLYVKGAPEILLEKCTTMLIDATKEPVSSDMTDQNRCEALSHINLYSSRSLRTIAFVYRDFDKWPAKGARITDESRSEVKFDDIFKNMTFLGFVGIQDPLRDGVALAVKRCQDAGAVVRMVTGDNMITAKAIAKECGILTDDGLVMDGPEFRRLNKPEMLEIIPKLQVLARSSPEDKRILVKRLKHLGETVAVTGDGTNDAPALKTADIGFSMGIAGTEVSKEASAIILMDDNFSSIVKAMMWGRAVNDAVKKFLQFQVTVNITAVLLTFVTAVSNNREESVLTAAQLLWVNLIMDTMAALALATDPPSDSILDRKSEPKSAPLITITMWKMIMGEAVFQLIVTFLLYYGTESILSYKSSSEIQQIPTLVFNTFVWMQIFNQWNNRRLDNKFNIFEGVTRNKFFIGVNIIMITGQIMIIFVGGKAFNVKRLSGSQWAYSLILGFLSIPIGSLIRLIPDSFISRFITFFTISRTPPGPHLEISDEEEQFRITDPLKEVKEELRFLKLVKGGRLNNLKFAIQDRRDLWLTLSRSGSRSRSISMPRTPNADSQRDNNSITPHLTPESRKRSRSNRSRSNSALGATTVMAGIIAGSIAGWSPIDRTAADEEYCRPTPWAESEIDVNYHSLTKVNESITSDSS